MVFKESKEAKCLSCGNTTTLDSVFCSKCGQSLISQPKDFKPAIDVVTFVIRLTNAALHLFNTDLHKRISTITDLCSMGPPPQSLNLAIYEANLKLSEVDRQLTKTALLTGFVLRVAEELILKRNNIHTSSLDADQALVEECIKNLHIEETEEWREKYRSNKDMNFVINSPFYVYDGLSKHCLVGKEDFYEVFSSIVESDAELQNEKLGFNDNQINESTLLTGFGYGLGLAYSAMTLLNKEPKGIRESYTHSFTNMINKFKPSE